MENVRIDVLFPYLGQVGSSPFGELNNLPSAWTGRGSTVSDDDIDSAIAEVRLETIAAHPEVVVNGDDLKKRLKALL